MCGLGLYRVAKYIYNCTLQLVLINVDHYFLALAIKCNFSFFLFKQIHSFSDYRYCIQLFDI